MTKQRRWHLVAILLFAWGLLLLSASGRSLWIDEHFSVSIAGEKTVGAALSHVVETERRPPLYYLTLFAWTRLAGSTDMAWRLPSILWAVLLVALTARLAHALRLPVRLSALLLTASPFFLLFAPMVRPYAMTAALAVASTVALLSWCSAASPSPQPSAEGRGSAGLLSLWVRARMRAALAYIVLASLLVWTDYSAWGILLAHMLIVLAMVPRSRWRQWLAAQAVVVLLFMPWLGVAAGHATAGNQIEADLAGGPLGLAMKLAYPFLSFSSGETIFPWDARGALSLLLVNLLALYGLWRLRRTSALALCLLYALVPFLFVVVLFTFFIPQGTFVLIPSRAMAVYPVYVMLAAVALASLPRRWGALLGLLVAIAWAAAFANLLAGTHYHNPIYAVRMRALADMVASNAEPDDAVVSDQDSLFFYYYPHASRQANVFTDANNVYDHLKGKRRVWLISLGRDRTRVGAAAGGILDWLARNGYQERQRWGSGPEDPIYQRVKEWLLKRPDYEYKALVQLFVRP